ncbi:hypothetical protein ACFLUZ_06065 [Chloroflexota bacterium]
MPEDSGCCSDSSCGCRIDIFTTSRECPDCAKRLRLEGRSQLLEFRLACNDCGYHSPRLSPEELQEIL